MSELLRRAALTLLGIALGIPGIVVFSLLMHPDPVAAPSPGAGAAVAAGELREAQPKAEPKALVKARILAFNDFHGHLEPGDLSISAATGTPLGPGHVRAGGAAYLAAHLARAQEQNPDSVVVSAGDLVGGSPLISSVFHDRPTVEVANRFLDVGVVGNHEFDEGTAELRDLMANADFDVLAANVVDRAGRTVFPPSVLRKVGGATIGFIGTTTTDTPRLAHVPGGLRDVRFTEEASTIRRLAPQLRARGADAVVVLTHSGADRARDGINGCRGVRGPAVELTKQVADQVDAVISAHVHTSYNCRVGGTPLTSAASYGRLFTTVELTIDPNTHEVTSSTARNRVVDHSVTPDRGVAALVRKHHDRVRPLADRTVGELRATADRYPTPAGESALGDLVADAHLAATASRGARIALVNRGFLRGDLARGPVTFGEVFTALPFEHHLVTMTLTGVQLQRVLEEQFCAGDPAEEDPRDTLEVSRGFSYRFDPEAPCGDRIRMEDLRLDGAPVSATAPYRVTTNSFYAPGVNGFPTFARGTDRSSGDLDRDALAAHLRSTTSAPVPGSRITTR